MRVIQLWQIFPFGWTFPLIYFLRLVESSAEQVRNICQLYTPSLYLVCRRTRSSCAEKKGCLVQLDPDPDPPSITSSLTLSKWLASSSFSQIDRWIKHYFFKLKQPINIHKIGHVCAFLFLHRMSFHLVDTNWFHAICQNKIFSAVVDVWNPFFTPTKGHRYFSFIGLGLIDGHAVYTWTLKQQVELYLYLSEWTITLHRSP